MITSNVTVVLRITPEEKNKDGTYDESKVEQVSVKGEMRVVKKLEYRGVSGQPIDAILGIKYFNDIDKDRTNVIYGNRYFRILTVKPSPIIHKYWKLLDLQEVYK